MLLQARARSALFSRFVTSRGKCSPQALDSAQSRPSEETQGGWIQLAKQGVHTDAGIVSLLLFGRALNRKMQENVRKHDNT